SARSAGWTGRTSTTDRQRGVTGLETGAAVAVGMSFGPILAPPLAAAPALLDYVEVPYEQLRISPATAEIGRQLPIVLHCSSMSVAGFVPPEERTLGGIQHLVSVNRHA